MLRAKGLDFLGVERGESRQYKSRQNTFAGIPNSVKFGGVAKLDKAPARKAGNRGFESFHRLSKMGKP